MLDIFLLVAGLYFTWFLVEACNKLDWNYGWAVVPTQTLIVTAYMIAVILITNPYMEEVKSCLN